VETVLDNPVYNALISGDASLSHGKTVVKYFDEIVSPFVGFPVDYSPGFSDLTKACSAGSSTCRRNGAAGSTHQARTFQSSNNRLWSLLWFLRE